MGAAVGIASALAPFVAPLVGGIAQSFLSGAGGPGGNPLSLFATAFSGLLDKAKDNPLGMLLAPLPTLFSTAGMAPQTLSDPMSQLQPEMSNFREIGSSNYMARSYQTDSEPVVRDHRTGDAGGGVVVRDHRHSDGPVVRDHRTPRGPVVVPPPARPPYRPPTSGGSSGGGVLDSLQNDVDRAKAALLANPKDPTAALELQEAMQALQTVSKLLSDESAMYASIQNAMIQNSKVS